MEADLVDWLTRRLPRSSQVVLGVGDDAALIAPSTRQQVVTTDLVCDGVHFVSTEVAPESIGHKALAVNLSDLAAMAALPRYAVVSTLWPHDFGLSRAQRVYEGLLALAEQYDVDIVGGDTNCWTGQLVLSVTLVGEVTPRGPLTRQAAKPGDVILITGSLGGSLTGHHLNFMPRVNEALELHRRYALHAGMDVTDGLAIDLNRLIVASQVGAELHLSRIPISVAAKQRALVTHQTPLSHALSDGEDFELLFTAAPETAEQIVREQPLEIPITSIGTIVRRPGLWHVTDDQRIRKLAATGYLHGAGLADAASATVPQMVELIRSEDEMEAFGARLARQLPAGLTVCLNGTLGAGKTRLAQAIAVALGVTREEVVSPTYTIVHEYRGEQPIEHLDLYRVADDDELFELGWDEYLESDHLKLIEWAERFADHLPDDRLEIRITLDEWSSDVGRQLEVQGFGAQAAQVVNALNKT